MTTITLNDKEYNVEDFTEEQKKIFGEIVFADNLIKQLNYQAANLAQRKDNILSDLEGSLNAKS
jgi:hypothetical protein